MEELIWFLILAVPLSVPLADFIIHAFTGNRLRPWLLLRFFEVVYIVLYPFYFLYLFDLFHKNDCCGESAVFSPNHRLTIYVWVVLSALSLLYSTFRTEIAGPLAEVLINIFIIFGIVISIFICIQLQNLGWMAIAAIGPLILFALTNLLQNQYKILQLAKEKYFIDQQGIHRFAHQVLLAPVFVKFPLLVFLCLPLFFVLTTFLLLFGQKTNSIILAFTQTYKQGFSELDYLCENVHCGGHFLCSVAANGHRAAVKPIRYGMRNHGLIICNRQLLIANAFEECLEERMPRLHKLIRTRYNHVGKLIHKHYGIFQNKFFADLIYFLMKPLEWIFVLIIYLIDRHPEDRIAMQYLEWDERKIIKESLMFR